MTHRILEAEQHHLQAVQRHCSREQLVSEVQQAAGQLLPVWGADVVSQAADELGDVVCGQRGSIGRLLRDNEGYETATGLRLHEAEFMFQIRWGAIQNVQM